MVPSAPRDCGLSWTNWNESGGCERFGLIAAGALSFGGRCASLAHGCSWPLCGTEHHVEEYVHVRARVGDNRGCAYSEACRSAFRKFDVDLYDEDRYVETVRCDGVCDGVCVCV
jgi:hypothetical protein